MARTPKEKIREEDLQGFKYLKALTSLLAPLHGTGLSALPKLVKAMWGSAKGKHGVKLHTQFELLKGVPVRMDLTDGDYDERTVLASTLQSGRVYVMDRGYAKFQLFVDILNTKSSVTLQPSAMAGGFLARSGALVKA